jgi:hypothetical protein
VRAVPHGEFARMLAQPYNHQFATALAPPPEKPSSTVRLEVEPNLRMLGLSPRQLLYASTAAILVFIGICSIFLVRAIRQASREEGQ